MKFFSLSRATAKSVGCSALVALSLGLASQLHAQVYTSYSTNFNNDIPNNTLDGQDGWTTNDGNEPDSVAVNGLYSTSSTDYLAGLGGQNISDPTAAPSVSPAYLTHGFNPVGTGYTFNADFAVTNSTVAYPNVNAFAFTFQQSNITGTVDGVAGSASTYNNIFSIDFVPNGTNVGTNAATKDLVEYSTYSPSVLGGTQTQSQTSTGLFSTLNSRYHLSLSVNSVANTMQFSIYAEYAGGAPLAGSTYTSPVITLNALNAGALINSFSATYLNGQNISAGSNALFFDNVSAVPEPSTWAMMGLGALGLVVSFRRKARA